MEVSHTPGDGQNLEFDLLHFAAPLLEKRQSVIEQSYVVRQVAQDEHRHYCQDHTDGLMPLAALYSQQRADNAAVAERHDQQWQKEAKDNLEAWNQHLYQHCCFILLERQLTLHGDRLSTQILFFKAIGVDERGQTQNRRQHPHSSAGEAAVGQSARGLGPKVAPSLNYSHVPITADACQQQHATVEVDAVGRPQGLASHGAHQPTVLLVVYDEGQSRHKDQVCQSHVEKVDVRHGLGFLVEHVGDDHESVANQAEGTDEGVEVGLGEDRLRCQVKITEVVIWVI